MRRLRLHSRISACILSSSLLAGLACENGKGQESSGSAADDDAEAGGDDGADSGAAADDGADDDSAAEGSDGSEAAGEGDDGNDGSASADDADDSGDDTAGDTASEADDSADSGDDSGDGSDDSGDDATGSTEGDDGGDEATTDSGDGADETEGDEGDSGSDGGDDPWTDDYDCDWGDPSTWAKTRQPTSAIPDGLPVENTPMFIAMGWDDNGFVDGMDWILDYLEGKKNPPGIGNDCTFDGTKTRHSFYMTSMYALGEQWGRAYEQGHEIANHTHTHNAETLPQNPDKQVWLDEMTICNEYLLDEVGVPESQLIGFRTPFLSQADATMEAIVEMGFVYDCSIEHYRLLSEGQYVWPYTLDGGPDKNSTFPGFVNGAYPGLWELPVYDLQTDAGGSSTVTGFDYNMWAKSGMTRAQFVSTLKHSLDHRLATNRAPLLIGMHTDYYSKDNVDANNASSGASYDQRRAAVEEFLDYAMTAHPDIRIVSYAQILQWVRAPVGLDGSRLRK